MICPDVVQTSVYASKAFQTKDTSKIFKIWKQLGKSYIYRKEFLIISVWFFKNLNTQTNISEMKEVLQNLVRFYPSNPYMFFIVSKVFLHIERVSGLISESDQIHIIEIVKNIITNIYQDSLDVSQEEDLKRIFASLSSLRIKLMVHSVTHNTRHQILYAINLCKTILQNKINKPMKILITLILIECYKSLDLNEVANSLESQL